MSLLSYWTTHLAISARYYSSNANLFYDVVIVGGGMVGNAMACSMGLSKKLSSKKILLLESGDLKPLTKTPIYSNRVSAISPPSVTFFKSLSKKLSSKKILLLESGDLKPLTKTPIYSNRVSAISPPSVTFFKKLGIWEKLEKYRVKRVDRLEVIDSCSRSTIRFEQPNPSNEIAYIVENNAIIAFLIDRIREQCNNVEIKTNTKVDNCT
uniref:DAO domain-containing protein n=1 Tax=Ascaris lumbricoides TaxID=6252 RepID=A0A0M3II51_ASCLU